jgi:membrane-associated phospholipid phosphatase
MKKLLILLMLLHTITYAKSDSERAGDILTLLIPAVALGATLYNKDINGSIEFVEAYGSTAAATQILKYTVKEQRPNNSVSYTSFPSGHSSSAFSGASFIHKRYGIKYAIPAYIGAIYTAYSRVKAEKHYTHDVIAGALLGMGFSWYFVSPYKNLQVTPDVNKDSYGLQFNYKW